MREFLSAVAGKSDNAYLNYTQSYISIVVDGRNAYLFDKRTQPNSAVWFNVKDDEREEVIRDLFSSKNVVFSFNNNYQDFSLTINRQFVNDNRDLLAAVHTARYRPYVKEEDSDSSEIH